METAVRYRHAKRISHWTLGQLQFAVSWSLPLVRPANQKGFSFPRRYNSIVKAPRFHKLCTLPSLHHDRSVISDPTHTTLSPEDTYFPELPADDHSQDGTKRHACSEAGVTSHSPERERCKAMDSSKLDAQNLKNMAIWMDVATWHRSFHSHDETARMDDMETRSSPSGNAG